MNPKSVSCSEIFAAYKNWISRNPQLTSDLETTVKWVSYFLAGRIQNSGVLSELVYLLSNLLVLFNDRIIRSARLTTIENGRKIKTFLTVIEYSEVFLEIAARRLWGQRGKWIIVAIVQSFKCLSRLVLLLKYKEKITKCPPIAPLQRNKIAEGPPVDVRTDQYSQSFTLSSGRVVRTISSAPPMHCRTWTAPQPPPLTEEEEERLATQHTSAEVIYITKPMVHLASCLAFGEASWKPWLFSMLMDVTSLQMYRKSKLHLTQKQRLELSRRALCMLFYILRSPFYERYSKTRLHNLLEGLSNNLPLVHHICRPLQRYIPEWQAIYFYMWSA
ncbi:peroxisomal membrane protein PEX16 [Neocloeon triangulifer]|uniref:peroxisomal membrane protein PEX16 n=1 Tax=Neocloeon triangulifer TaxID=2078957 RepID=UPI00286F4041|nr:peroxisomal membrane protein PEX16 [Neocloeon triangulifer]